MNDQQILQALGLENSVKAVQDKSLEAINTIVELRVSGLIQELLNDEQKEQFVKKSETEDKEAVLQWVSDEITDVSKLYESVLKDYLEEFHKKNK